MSIIVINEIFIGTIIKKKNNTITIFLNDLTHIKYIKKMIGVTSKIQDDSSINNVKIERITKIKRHLMRCDIKIK